MRTVINDRSRDEEIGRLVAEKTDIDWCEDYVCVGVEKGGKFVAGVMFNEFNGSNVCAHMFADTPYSLTNPFLRECFSVAFRDMDARRITAPVVQDRAKVLQVLLKMGFTCEAILKDYCNSGNLYMMVMWPDNCKYLEN